MICTDGHVRMIYRLLFLFCMAILLIFFFVFVFIRGFGYTWNMEQKLCVYMLESTIFLIYLIRCGVDDVLDKVLLFFFLVGHIVYGIDKLVLLEFVFVRIDVFD